MYKKNRKARLGLEVMHFRFASQKKKSSTKLIVSKKKTGQVKMSILTK